MVDWRKVRALFPAVEKRIYLNTAGGAPISSGAAEAGRRYYEQSLQDGDVHWDAWLEQVEEVRGKVAALINASPRQVSFTANASTGLSIAAHMLEGRGGVLAVADEFPSVTLPWLQLGYRVEFVPSATDGSVTVEDLAARLDDSMKVLAVSFVQFKSGFRNDLVELGELCVANDMSFVVDATQGFGAFPIDVDAAQIDFLVSSGYKWATAGYSVAALYVSHRFLNSESFPLVGWRSSQDPYALVYDRLELADRAAALEQGHPPFAGVFSLGASLDLIEEIGIASISERIVELVTYLRGRLRDKGIHVSSTGDEQHLSGITIVDVANPERVVEELARRGVIVSSRGRGIRVSLHFYNNHADVDRFIDELVECQRHDT